MQGSVGDVSTLRNPRVCWGSDANIRGERAIWRETSTNRDARPIRLEEPQEASRITDSEEWVGSVFGYDSINL